VVLQSENAITSHYAERQTEMESRRQKCVVIGKAPLTRQAAIDKTRERILVWALPLDFLSVILDRCPVLRINYS